MYDAIIIITIVSGAAIGAIYCHVIVIYCQSSALALANALDFYYTNVSFFLFLIYRSLLRDRRKRSEANFSRTCPSAWITKL